jgi:hypothetical protein
MMKRRNFLSLAAASVPAAAVGSLTTGAFGQRAPNPDASLTFQHSGSNSCLPDFSKLPTKMAAKTEVMYKTTHGKPNGLAVTNNPNELWVIDQGTDRWVTLTNIADGSVIREFQTDVVGPSGVVIDDDNVMWLTSTHNSLIIAIDPSNGKTIGKYISPGSGRIYEKRGDPPARSSKLPTAYPDLSREVDARAGRPAGRGRRGGGPQMPPGQLPMDTEEGAGGTGAHGILSKGDLLIYACPPSRAIFSINKKTWEVQDVWPTPGNRPHGMTWADDAKTSFWNVDSNENAFYHYNATTGQISQKVAVQEDPHTVCHGAKLMRAGPGAGYMYFCDDVGWICRIKWA